MRPENADILKRLEYLSVKWKKKLLKVKIANPLNDNGN
jgi:hypothetical protein